MLFESHRPDIGADLKDPGRRHRQFLAGDGDVLEGDVLDLARRVIAEQDGGAGRSRAAEGDPARLSTDRLLMAPGFG